MSQSPTVGSPGPADATALILFSGGQDSATCLAWALERFARVETVGFDYGQRHVVEMEARLTVRAAVAAAFPAWAARLGDDHVLDIASFGKVAESALTADRAIEVTERGCPPPSCRGATSCSSSTPRPWPTGGGADVLVGGMCETDFSGYPDCRRDTIDAQEQALRLGMARPFRIETPLMRLTKAQTWALAHDLGGDALVQIILEDSHTCYRGERGMRHAWGYGCGHCPACELRARGWAEWSAGRRRR